MEAIMNKESMSAQYLHDAWKSSSAVSGNQLENNLVWVYNKLTPSSANKTLENAEQFSKRIGQIVRNADKTKYKTVDKKKNPIPLGVT